jgi:hypothetical protein
VETGQAWEPNAPAGGAGPESMGAGDDPFVDHLGLGCLALPTGELLLADAGEERRSAPCKALIAQRLAARGAPGRSLGRERAQALSPRAPQGLACLSIPARLPLVPASGKSAALALGRPRQQARRAWQQAEAGLQPSPALERPPPLSSAGRQPGEGRPAAGRHGAASQSA